MECGVNYMVSWVFDKQRERKRRPEWWVRRELPEKLENKSRIYHRYPTRTSSLVLIIIDGTLPVRTNLAGSLAATGFILNFAHAFVAIHEASSTESVCSNISRARAGCGGHGQLGEERRWWLEAEWLLRSAEVWHISLSQRSHVTQVFPNRGRSLGENRAEIQNTGCGVLLGFDSGVKSPIAAVPRLLFFFSATEIKKFDDGLSTLSATLPCSTTSPRPVAVRLSPLRPVPADRPCPTRAPAVERPTPGGRGG